MNITMEELQLWKTSWLINKRREAQEHSDWIAEEQPIAATIFVSSICKRTSFVIIKHVHACFCTISQVLTRLTFVLSLVKLASCVLFSLSLVRGFLTMKEPLHLEARLKRSLKVIPWMFCKQIWMNVKQSFMFYSKYSLNLNYSICFRLLNEWSPLI